ncbi:hypothetical protein C8R46DRAFT_904856 [Mycena filopes]|nr:hypothetical protein C8R46DRAFT_904856 [Mycena filopes]
MHHIVTRVLLNKSSYTDSVNQTPYFAGIISGSIVWVVYCWATRLIHRAFPFPAVFSITYHAFAETQSHAFTHLLFGLSVGLCAYNFFRAVTLDPGTCPKPASDAELKSIIEDLASEGRLNGQTFCIHPSAQSTAVCATSALPGTTTIVRGYGIVVSLPILQNAACSPSPRIFSAVILPVPDASIPTSSSCPLPSSLCAITAYDSFLVSVAAWATLQLSWTSVLLASQFWQIARQMTTLEVSNLGRYGFMGGRGGASLNGQMGHRHAAPEAADGGDAGGAGGAGSAGHAHSHGGSGFLMNLLGLDRFTRGKAVDGLARAGRAANPFDLGAYRNCRDFWTNGKELGVEYERLYDVPLEGFEEARRRKEREEEEDGLSVGSGGRAGKGRRGLFMGLTMGRAGSSRGGYEPLSQV